MTEINLLPWREQQIKQANKKAIIMLITGIFILLIILCAARYYLATLIDKQTVRNALVQEEIKTIDYQIREINLLKKSQQDITAKSSVMQSLYATRSLIIHMLDELIKNMPAGVYLTRLERKDHQVVLSGRAKSSINIINFMKNIENNLWIHNPTLAEIKKKDKTQQDNENEFTLNFRLQPVMQNK